MTCSNCGQEISFWKSGYKINNKDLCPDCYENHGDELREKADGKNFQSKSKPQIGPTELDKITLTTETCSKDFEIEERLGIISSESALGMNMFRDIFANVRDIFGGKSISTQKILTDLKSNAFQELKKQAYNLNANAVIAIDLDYSEFSGGGKSMLFLVATGTAVRFKKSTSNKDLSSA